MDDEMRRKPRPEQELKIEAALSCKGEGKRQGKGQGKNEARAR
jgi:hypothetical protein